MIPGTVITSARAGNHSGAGCLLKAGTESSVPQWRDKAVWMHE
jgi:hypothetical protein